MKTFKCEEMMCSHCVSRIEAALSEAEIAHTIDLELQTVSIEECEQCETRATEILEDLGFSAVEILN